MKAFHVLAVLTAVLVAIPATEATSATSPPSIDDDALRLSVDGRSWSPVLEVPLFDAARRWVPGDSETVALWVQNGTDDAAELTVGFVGSDGPSLLDVDGVRLAATVDGRTRTITADADAQVATVERLAGGARERIDLTVTLDPATGNDAQGASFDLLLVVRLTELVGGDVPAPVPTTVPGAVPTTVPGAPVPTPPMTAPPGGRGPSGPLPSTGSTIAGAMAVAGLLVLVGSCLAVHRRRGRDAVA